MGTNRLMDKLADVDTKFKMLVVFFVLVTLPAGANLMLLYYYPSKQIVPFAALYLVLMIVIQFPLCGWLSNVVVLRNITKINAYCQEVKRGMYHSSFALPPEKGDENDFLRAKRNLYWMGQIIAAREEKLVKSLKALNIAQTKVMESIEYASRIQHTLLPSSSMLDAVFEGYFVWWEPRDVVGGDTYWVTPSHDGYFVAVIDCTGHGVPGAFMTLIVHTLLEKCAEPQFSNNPGLVLRHMNIQLKTFLGRNDAACRIDDGFDAVVCHINAECGEVTFAGAGLSVFYETHGKICEIKGDRMGVGDSRVPVSSRYTNHTVKLAGPMKFYLATDGITDQVGGQKRLPFGKNRLKRLLTEVSGLPFAEQQKHLAQSWRAYAGHEDKRDDLTLLGFSVGAGLGDNVQINYLKGFYEGLKDDGIILSFSGPLSQVILEGIGETIRKKMKMELTEPGTIQRVFSVFIEQSQNIMNYSAEISASVGEGEDEIRVGILVLGFQDERYYVCCGNYITLERAEPLVRDLTMIRELKPEALRKLYKERRRANPPADSMGAGLGFIEIARRSTEPIVFDVQPLNDKFAFFAVKTVV